MEDYLTVSEMKNPEDSIQVDLVNTQLQDVLRQYNSSNLAKTLEIPMDVLQKGLMTCK